MWAITLDDTRAHASDMFPFSKADPLFSSLRWKRKTYDLACVWCLKKPMPQFHMNSLFLSIPHFFYTFHESELPMFWVLTNKRLDFNCLDINLPVTTETVTPPLLQGPEERMPASKHLTLTSPSSFAVFSHVHLSRCCAALFSYINDMATWGLHH